MGVSSSLSCWFPRDPDQVDKLGGRNLLNHLTSSPAQDSYHMIIYLTAPTKSFCHVHRRFSQVSRDVDVDTLGRVYGFAYPIAFVTKKKKMSSVDPTKTRS